MSDADPTQLRADVLWLQTHTTRREEILVGDLFPTTDDLRSGLPFFKDSLSIDLRTWVKAEVLKDDIEPVLRDALELAADHPTRETLWAAAATANPAGEQQQRLDLYAAWLGDDLGRDRTVRRGFDNLVNQDFGAVSGTVTLALGLAFRTHWRSIGVDITSTKIDGVIDRGVGLLARLQDISSRLTPAMEAVEAGDSLEELMRLVDEDRAEIVIEDGIPEAYLGNPAPEPEPLAPGAIVVPALDPKRGTSHTRDIIKTWAGIAGERLPITQVQDLSASAALLVTAWPWAEEVVHTILADLSAGGDVVFDPTCLVGPPGCGKTAMLRGIAKELGLPSQGYDLGGQADSSLMGTSSRFGTAEESAVLQFIKREKMASVAFIWDELEKASEGRQNGSAQDAMLPFLVRHQAARLRDPCLNVEVNLSFVSHFATANTLSGIPAPLKDRMRVIRMPEPRPQDIGLLTERILDDVAKRRNLNRAWLPPLAEDELDIIRDAWSGGSIRRLERYVEITLAKRDQHMMGRA